MQIFYDWPVSMGLKGSSEMSKFADLLGRPLGYSIFSRIVLIRDPIY